MPLQPVLTQNHIGSLLACLVTALLLPSANAALSANDPIVLLLNNGDRVSGTLIEDSSEAVILQTNWGGELTIPRAAISSTASPSKIAEETETAPPATAIADALSNPENLPAPPTRWYDWDGTLTATAALSNGNTDSSSLFTALELERVGTKLRQQLRASTRRGQVDNERTQNQWQFSYGADRFLRTRWYLSGDVDYQRDRIGDLDYRVTTTGSGGLQIIQTDAQSLSAELGISTVLQRIGDRDGNTPALRWSLDFERSFGSFGARLFHRHAISVLADRSRGTIATTSTGVEMSLTERLNATVRFDTEHETKPADNRAPSDRHLEAGLSYAL